MRGGLRGGLTYQIHTLFGSINCIGQPKIKAKQAFYAQVRKDKERVKAGEIKESERLKGTTAELAARVGVYSHRTADLTRDEWKRLAEYAQKQSGKSMSKFNLARDVNANTVKDYLSVRFAELKANNDKGILDTRTAQNICGYITKYALALDRLDGLSNPSERTLEIRTAAANALQLSEPTKTYSVDRSHKDPLAVIEWLRCAAEEKPKMENILKSYIASRILYETGCRVGVVTLINDTSKTQIDGNIMSYKTKAGQEGITIHGNALSDETVKLLADYKALHNGEFRLNDSTYWRWLHKAEKATGDHSTGAHAFRYDRAKIYLGEQIAEGKGFKAAVSETAEMLDHHRSDVTLPYVRGE